MRLKSGGDTVAELRIPKGRSFTFEGGHTEYDYQAERATLTGGATVKISSGGAPPVVVKADEIDAVLRGE